MTTVKVQSANVDKAEIAKFDALASRWWDRNSEFRPLHEINPLRLNFMEKLITLPGKKCLDVGCGGGILTEGLAQRGATVTGIDLAPSPLQVARMHLLESGLQIDYQQIAAEEFAEKNGAAFDSVSCLEMLEHVPDPASIISACATLTKPGGMVFFSTINRNPKAWALAVVGAEYILNMLPRGTHEYRKFLKPSELAAAARKSGLELVRMEGMTYNPLTRQYALSTDTDVNYLAAFRKPGQTKDS